MNYPTPINVCNVLGNFIEDLPPCQEYLILSFSPSSMPLEKRWRNNCLSAEFLADYLSTFFTANKTEQKKKRAEVQNAVSYVANELLENAMKYSQNTKSSPVTIQIYLNQDNIIFKLANNIDLSMVINFKTYIENLVNSDPCELYIRQLEKNAIDDSNGDSGLGFLTMINDYNAKLGWKFEKNSSMSSQQEDIIVTTMVQLQV